VVQDGDTITIDANKHRIDMDVGEEEVKKRFESWRPPRMPVTRGVLAKYARLVGDASKGALIRLHNASGTQRRRLDFWRCKLHVHATSVTFSLVGAVIIAIGVSLAVQASIVTLQRGTPGQEAIGPDASDGGSRVEPDTGFGAFDFAEGADTIGLAHPSFNIGPRNPKPLSESEFRSDSGFGGDLSPSARSLGSAGQDSGGELQPAASLGYAEVPTAFTQWDIRNVTDLLPTQLVPSALIPTDGVTGSNPEDESGLFLDRDWAFDMPDFYDLVDLDMLQDAPEVPADHERPSRKSTAKTVGLLAPQASRSPFCELGEDRNGISSAPSSSTRLSTNGLLHLIRYGTAEKPSPTIRGRSTLNVRAQKCRMCGRPYETDLAKLRQHLSAHLIQLQAEHVWFSYL
ncbi:hypothetical protein B0A55_08456, partial [Friedmanniomyces simplex]